MLVSYAIFSNGWKFGAAVFPRIGKWDAMKIFLLMMGVVAAAGVRAAEKEFSELDPKRVAAIEAILPEVPSGFGVPSTMREAWSESNRVAMLGRSIKDAEKLLSKELPAWDDEAYLDFSKTGQRPPGEAMLSRRSGWLYPLVVAECVENKGRFLSKINFVLKEYAKEKSWTLPAHDRGLGNFKGTAYDVDLRSSWFAAELAQALYLLGEKLDAEARAAILAAMEQKVFSPMRVSFRTGKGCYWLRAEHNWNAVCLNGVVCAALAAIPDKHERAIYVAAAEHYSDYFMRGFTEDGWCAEGAGYWNYGFGNFLNLRERVLQVTGGRINLFDTPKIRNVALYGLRVQMNDQQAPPYADCHSGSKPDQWLVRYCNLVLGLGVRGYEPPLSVRQGNLNTMCMDSFPNSANKPVAGVTDQVLGPRSFFNAAGVLVCRPGTNESCKLAASIKAGGNGNHSHNDVGSFVVQLGKEQLVGEPGGPKHYNADTFSSKRYTFKILNSFSHPVPVIAGKLQEVATKLHPKVLKTNYSDMQDEIAIDMTTAYAVPELTSYVRTFRFNREGQGSVIVEDSFQFKSPQTVEMSLPTHAKWKQSGDRVFEFGTGANVIKCGIQTPDGFDVASEEIADSSPVCTRIGLTLKKPVESATIRMAFVPAASDSK